VGKMTDPLDLLYEELSERVSEDPISATAKAIVLIRVAIESSAKELGLPRSLFLVTSMLATTLDIMASEDTSCVDENFLKEVDVSDLTPN